MNEIKELINKYPKHYSAMIKKSEIMRTWVKLNSKLPDTANWTDHIYSSLTQQTGICKFGSQMKFKNITIGFGFCGPAGVCECARESVSNKVMIAKAKRTPDAINQENQKREKTTLEKYGVTNNAQTETALVAHSLFYTDRSKVAVITARIKDTKQNKHGDPNFNNRKKCEETCLQKYGFKNTWSLTDSKQNPFLTILRDKDLLRTLFPKYSVKELSEKYNLHAQTIYYYLNLHGFRELYQSTFEQEIVYFLKELGISNIVTNTRKLIGKELDIFLPDFNLAIEYNGEYWHHDKVPHITSTYHYDKFKKCEENGITLFTIFGNSWSSKKAIWKEKIKNQINLKQTDKIGARQTKIIQLKPAETKDFLDKNHVQGYCVAQYCYGLTYNDVIVALMTFSKNRIGIGKDRGIGTYELVRYATSRSVMGGASKLLKMFIVDHTPIQIVSYSDNQYSIGAMYVKLGFTMEKDNKAGYWYYDPVKKISYHRYKFAKHTLVKAGHDPSKTEKIIMDELGYLRIWNCGTRTWIMPVTSVN